VGSNEPITGSTTLRVEATQTVAQRFTAQLGAASLTVASTGLNASGPSTWSIAGAPIASVNTSGVTSLAFTAVAGEYEVSLAPRWLDANDLFDFSINGVTTARLLGTGLETLMLSLNDTLVTVPTMIAPTMFRTYAQYDFQTFNSSTNLYKTVLSLKNGSVDAPTITWSADLSTDTGKLRVQSLSVFKRGADMVFQNTGNLDFEIGAQRVFRLGADKRAVLHIGTIRNDADQEVCVVAPGSVDAVFRGMVMGRLVSFIDFVVANDLGPPKFT